MPGSGLDMLTGALKRNSPNGGSTKGTPSQRSVLLAVATPRNVPIAKCTSNEA